MSRLQPVLLVGSRDSGKTAYAATIVDRARSAGLTVAGFLSEADVEGGSKRRYHLRDLATGERTIYARTADGRYRPDDCPSDAERVGRFHIDRAVLQRAGETIARSLDADLICIDEVGPLELSRGAGFLPALRLLLERYQGIVVITVRPAFAGPLKELIARSTHNRPAEAGRTDTAALCGI